MGVGEIRKEVKQEIDSLVSNLACCDRDGCRCWQAVQDLKNIKTYVDAEIERAEVRFQKEASRER